MTKEKFAKLIEVKSIISIVAAIVFGVLSIQGKIGVDNTMILLTMVFQSFFSYQTSKNNKENQSNQDE